MEIWYPFKVGWYFIIAAGKMNRLFSLVAHKPSDEPSLLCILTQTGVRWSR